ncbi:zinc ribbon domain-containing protein [Candidatus Heimdallarchaeota archaeon]|nr:MAG: zinc ribbon domain-containing protein [Candidatus Heimdallarchaeota archaeon]
MSKILYCSNCGSQNVDHSVYCSNCGSKFKETVLKPSIADSREETTTPSAASFIADPPFGALIIAVIILFFMNSIAGFVIWMLFMFYQLGFLIYAIVCVSLAGCFFIYLLYTVFSRNYLIQNMQIKDTFKSYKDILEKNLEILFDQKLFSGSTKKKILIFLTILLMIGFIGSIIAGVVIFILFINEYIWYY